MKLIDRLQLAAPTRARKQSLRPPHLREFPASEEREERGPRNGVSPLRFGCFGPSVVEVWRRTRSQQLASHMIIGTGYGSILLFVLWLLPVLRAVVLNVKTFEFGVDQLLQLGCQGGVSTGDVVRS